MQFTPACSWFGKSLKISLEQAELVATAVWTIEPWSDWSPLDKFMLAPAAIRDFTQSGLSAIQARWRGV